MNTHLSLSEGGLSCHYPLFERDAYCQSLAFDTAVAGQKLLTPQQAKDSLARRGLAVRAWARDHGVSHAVVYRVLDKRCKGLRGEGHRVAVLLGIKDGELA